MDEENNDSTSGPDETPRRSGQDEPTQAHRAFSDESGEPTRMQKSVFSQYDDKPQEFNIPPKTPTTPRSKSSMIAPLVTVALLSILFGLGLGYLLFNDSSSDEPVQTTTTTTSITTTTTTPSTTTVPSTTTSVAPTTTTVKPTTTTVKPTTTTTKPPTTTTTTTMTPSSTATTAPVTNTTL